MSTNSTSDSKHNDDDESLRADFWKVMTSKVSSNLRLELLELWIEGDLASIETEFAPFISNHSMGSDLRKSRGSSDKH